VLPSHEISKSEEKKKIIVTIEEVEKAIQKLNSGKSADEYGITAEHVKFAGSKIYTLYQFFEIFSKEISLFFWRTRSFLSLFNAVWYF
jgi:hypothetical protein